MDLIRERLRKLKEILQEGDCEVFISFSPVENRYFSGFTGSTSCLISGVVGDFLFTDFRYEEQVYNEVKSLSIKIIRKNLEEEVINFLKKHNLTKLGIVLEKTSARLYERFKGEGFSICGIDDDISYMRMVKDNNEVNLIREACKITEVSIEKAIEVLKEGISEKDVAGYIEYQFKVNGAETAGFDTIVLFGSNSSLPHGKPSKKGLKPGDIVLFDCGCVYKGYYSDITRTFVYGAIPGLWFKEIYSITLDAQKSALGFIKAEVLSKDVDYTARYYIEKRGLGKFFGHGLGHGVGLEIHEPPRLSKDSTLKLKSGMVVTVEPGIYIPGKGGVRIEDTVLVTDTGCEILTSMGKELRVIE